MTHFLSHFLSEHYIPHGHCYLWQPGLVSLHAFSDLITALAYYLIPFTLIYFVRKRRDIPFPEIFLLFSVFILTCGTTHLLEVWTLWHPLYWVSGLVKAATAIVSLFTAIELIPLVPQALALASPAQLEAINQDLIQQVKDRQQAEAELRQYKAQLEELVAERAAELTQSNQQLQQEIVERQQAEQQIQFQAALLSQIRNAVICTDLEGRITFWNHFAETLYQWQADEVIGRSVAEVLAPLSQKQTLSDTLTNLQKTFQSQGEYLLQRKDGEMIVVLSTTTAIRDEQGNAVGFMGISVDISDRKQAEVALVQSEAQYRLLFENNPNPMWIFDNANLNFLAVNDAAILLYGYSRSEFLTMTIFDIRPLEDRLILKEKLSQKVSSNFYKAEWRHQRKNGDVFSVEISSHPITWENKAANFVLAKDISERKRLEAERQQAEAALQKLNQELDQKVQERTQALAKSKALLHEREQAFRVLVENTPDIVTRFDRNLHHLYVSPSIQQATGLSADVFVGKTNEELGMPPDLAAQWATSLQTVFTTGQPSEMEFSFPAVDGVRHYQSKIVPEVAADGSIASVLTTARDITTLKETQKALQQSEEFFRKLFEDAPLGIGIGALTSDRLFKVNGMFCQMLGYSAAELTSLSFADFTHPDDLAVSIKLRDELAAGIVPNHQLEKRYIKKTGEILWVSLSTSIIHDLNGKPLHRLVMVKNITERKQAEADLRQSENRLSLALEGAKAGMWDWDVQNNKGFWSEQNFRLMGCEPGCCEITFESWVSSIYPSDRERTVAALNRVVAEKTEWIWEYRIQLPDGSIRWIYSQGKLSCDEQGNPKVMTGIQMDISDRKQAEIVLQQKAQREQLLRIIAQRVRQSLDLDAILEAAVTEVRQMFQADRALIFQLLPGDKGEVIKESVLPQFPVLGEGRWTDACLVPDSIKHYCVGQPRIVSDIAFDDKWGECLGKLLHTIGVKSKISAPIIQTLEDGSTQIWGLLVVHSCAYRRLWQPDEASFLQQISNQLAIAIQQSSLYQRVQTELSERQQIETQLRASLQEKEVLLKEVHHRVKNNLQMVSSLLSLQANTIENPEVLKPFIESQQRVKTMALIHEKLYQSNNLAKINFAEYVQALVDSMFQSYQSAISPISLHVEVAPIELAVDVAIPCGLMINELVSNALKYAFPNHHSGEINIIFPASDTQQYRLTVADNGIGIPEDLNFQQSPSLGLQLVCALSRKLRGTIELDRTTGTQFTITF